MAKPQYGASEHYLGRAGERYFEKQNNPTVSAVNIQFFRPHLRPGGSILDFGCGGGDLLDLIESDIKVGIEINPVAQEVARSKGLEVYSQVDEVKGRQFDHVITSHALEHVPSPYHALIEFREVCKPDGTLIWLSPMDDWRGKVHRHWQPHNHDMHLYTWTPLSIGNLLVTSGYEPKQIDILEHAFPPYGGAIWNATHTKVINLAARASAVLFKRRQILVVARPATLAMKEI